MRTPSTVFIIHTSAVSLGPMAALFAELAPAVTVRNIMDDSLLPEVIAHGGPTDAVRQRLAHYFTCAERAGADLVFNQCSSVGEAADEAAEGLAVPMIKVDQRMCEVAVRTGRRIGVVATLDTTLGPSGRLLRHTAERLGRPVQLTERVCEGAFDKLVGNDRAGHNRTVLQTIRALFDHVDVVVCAQGSMAALVPELGETPVPVLTSPRLGVEHAVEILTRP